MTERCRRIYRLAGTLLAVVLAMSGCSDPPPAVSAYLTAVNDEWIPGESEVVRWHEIKDEKGPAFTGNDSWQQFLEFTEAQLEEYGVVDIQRNQWTFERWYTSQWLDRSGWSLVSDGATIEVASYGANSGSTGKEGVTAELAFYDPVDPPQDLDGRIVVFSTAVDEALVEQLGNADYEYLSDADSYPVNGLVVPDGLDNDLSAGIFLQLLQVQTFIEIATAGNAAGALFVLDGGSELMAGMYTFPVPQIYDVPSLYLDREQGRRVIADARAGKTATLRLEAETTESTAYQLIGYLPGVNYGTADDEVVQLVTHTDGPSISQDNGAYGILAVIAYMSRIPQAQRPRTLMVFLDCRHFMPGMEAAFAEQDWFARHPGARESIVGMVGIEHLGQIEYVEEGNDLVETGRVYPSLLWASNNEQLVEHAIDAVTTNALPSAYVRNIAVPGIHGRSQGRWFGMAKHAPSLGLPAYGMMGFMGAYWATSSGIERFDAGLFRTQVATLVQLTGRLMTADLAEIQPSR